MKCIRDWVDRVLETGGMLSMEDLNEGYRIKLLLDGLHDTNLRKDTGEKTDAVCITEGAQQG